MDTALKREFIQAYERNNKKIYICEYRPSFENYKLAREVYQYSSSRQVENERQDVANTGILSEMRFLIER